MTRQVQRHFEVDDSSPRIWGYTYTVSSLAVCVFFSQAEAAVKAPVRVVGGAD